jgi:hypothetical protein
MKDYSPAWQKLFIRLSREMNIMFPEIALSECYKIIEKKHLDNKLTTHKDVKIERKIYRF